MRGKSSSFVSAKCLCVHVIIILVSLGVITRTDHRSPLRQRVKLRAVVHFDGIETFYKSVFDGVKFRKTGENPTELGKSIVKSLCKNIFKASYFRANQEYWVNADQRSVRSALKKDHEDAFQTIYRKLERQSTSIRLRGDDYEYVNAYQRRKIFIDNDEKSEYLFTCLVRDRKSDHFKEYFVSPAYNVNLAPVPQPAIAGRFIFAYDDQRKLTLRAMAEESTKADLSNTCLNQREQSYLAVKRPLTEVGNNGITNSSGEDPLCQLTPGEKLRLCATAMTSTELRKKIKFVPKMENVDENCEARQISFRYKMWQRIADENVFEERMIACKTFNKKGRQIVYYVSQGYGVNKIFVYKARHNVVFIKNHMDRASVVRR